MPNHKHHRNHRAKDDENNNTNNVDVDGNGNNNQNGGAAQPRAAAADNHPEAHIILPCSVPIGCKRSDELIDDSEPGCAIRVHCNNEQCTMGRWMHKECFEEWEETVLAYLRSCGRARSWSEKQRLQNLWTKKGYDLAFKACDCKCGRGHLRKDLNYLPLPQPLDNARRQKKGKKKNDKPMPVVSTNHKQGYNQNHALANNQHHNHHHNHQNSNASNPLTDEIQDVNANGTTASTPILHGNSGVNGNGQNSNAGILHVNNNACGSMLRLRSGSVSSTGSSPPHSASSGSPLSCSPVNGNFYFKTKAGADASGGLNGVGTIGSIFRRRQDLSAFNVLPRYKQNPYNIKMEDEGPHGNDDTRSFVLSNLSSHKIAALRCVLCKRNLPVFDRYPLIDGSLFLSPQAYDESVIQVIWDGRMQFLNSVCISCLEGKTDVKCAACKRKWNGCTFVFGTMYTFDIFAAMPCCQKRLTCKHCRRAVVDVTSGLSYFSQYSHMIICPYCKANDYHFVRSLAETFMVKDLICC